MLSREFWSFQMATVVFIITLLISLGITFLPPFQARKSAFKTEPTEGNEKKFPPGPRGLPIVGNLLLLFQIKNDADNTLLKLAKKYHNICMVWLGSSPVIIVNSPKVAKDLLDKRGANYSSRPTQNTFRCRAWPFRLVITPVGSDFRLLRKLYNNLLGPQQSATFRKYQDYESKVMMEALLTRPQGFLDDTERFAMSVIFSACYGVRLAELDHPVMKEFYGVWEVMLKFFQPGSLLIDFIPILQRLPHSMQPWLRLAKKLRARELRLHKAFLSLLKNQVKEESAPTCFGTMLVQVQEEEKISDERACDILAMLIGAGSDTTSSYLQSFFKVMALHPEVVHKAQKELDAVVGTSRLPTFDDEPSLPYVRAIIKEVHRWAPIGSLGIPHATSKSDIYEGQYIPENTIVFPNLTALSRDPERYYNPDLFDPERFLGDELDANASALHAEYMKRDHFHYGFGRRLCQGIFVAEASLYIVVARILWAFDIKAIDGKKLNMNDKISKRILSIDKASPESWTRTNKLVEGLVTKPEPYEVSITSRGPEYESVIKDSVANSRTDILNFDDVELFYMEK